MSLLFIYGSLKRGAPNHRQMAGQRFVAEARTAPGYRLFNLGSYPAMVPVAGDRGGVHGEVWSVEPACLARLDEFEGAEYARRRVALLPPFADQEVETYFYLGDVTACPELGANWRG